MNDEKFCCEMRRKFVIGIVAERDTPVPVDAADFIDDWGPLPLIIRIRYCPFCGKEIDQDDTLRVTFLGGEEE